MVAAFNRIQIHGSNFELEAFDTDQLNIFSATFTESTTKETRDGIAELKERRRKYEQASKSNATTSGNARA
jgi:hypothetical protein